MARKKSIKHKKYCFEDAVAGYDEAKCREMISWIDYDIRNIGRRKLSPEDEAKELRLFKSRMLMVEARLIELDEKE